ncbi:MAG: ABC transporter ATP-binding protein [Clostridia bacterium]|nr:ABC transporter ATP-binding protein [Clostridia bacterium]
MKVLHKKESATKNGGFISNVKLLSKSIREYKKPSILTPLFVMIEVVFECLIPWVLSLLLGVIDYVSGSGASADKFTIKIVDFMSYGGEPNLLLIILQFGGIMLMLALLSLTCGAIAGRCCAKASSGFAKNLRKDLFANIQGFSFSNIDKFSSSSLVTRLTTDVTHVEMSYMMIIRTAIRAPFMLIFSLVMAFSINAKMALIFLCTIPILATGLFFIMTKAIPFFHRIFPKYDTLNESVEENIRGMRVVKSYVREDFEKDKFNRASSDVKDNFTKAEKIVAMNTPLMNFCVYTGILAIYIVGSSFIIKSNNSIFQYTQLNTFMSYSFQILMSLMMVSMIMVTIVMSIPAMRRIAEVLNEKPDIVSPENALTDIADGSVCFKDVCFKYSKRADRNALENINLDIKSGETVGIIGSTGSGKSSLVGLIPRLYDVSEGVVTVGGKDVKLYDVEALRDSVAMVLQKNVLFSGTIKENMRWGNKNATDEEIIEACKLAQADEFVSSFPDKYDTFIEQGGVNVSGGQKQRLCIARALLKKPKILILDDSTSAVDTKTDALIRASLKSYIPQTTKIIIAQRIASVQDADKIVILDNGKISAVGTHDELMKDNAIYQGLYYSQNKVDAPEKEVK